ncbi:MAG: hypothetical protein LBO72_00530 [Helicobacteraceae bacterium]|nr:hypothetical protein [Helicobacteraceae bacterium]
MIEKDKALRKELRKEEALKYAVFIALIGVITSLPIVFYRNQPDGFFVTFVWAFGGFLSGYISWRIIGGKSKTAAFFTGLLAGLLILLFAPLLLWCVLTLIDAHSNLIEDLIKSVILSLLFFQLGICMFGWFVVPLSIVIAFILRHKIRKQTSPANKYEQR